MVKENLDEHMIKAGEELIRKLDELHWPAEAALWFYFTEKNQWRLILGFRSVRREGPKKTYRKIQKALNELSEEYRSRIGLEDIFAVDSSYPVLKLLRMAISTGKDIVGIRFSRNVINGHLIEDAYIYRLL